MTISMARRPTSLTSSEFLQSSSAKRNSNAYLPRPRSSMGSAKNGWFDEQGRVFIICTLEEIMETMNCADNKATKLMNELEEKCGLIERKRQGQGKPNLIYVKNFISSVDNSGGQPPESRFKTRENHDSGVVKTTNQESEVIKIIMILIIVIQRILSIREGMRKR